jgi:large subunit ribosomal protein L2
MAIKKFNPITPGTRYKIANAFAELTTDKPEKSLLSKGGNTGGRNNQGRLSVRYRGGGHKQRYRIVDFKTRKTRYSCCC